MGSALRQVDKVKFVRALHAVVPSTSTPKYVSLANYAHVTVIVGFKNATTVTGSAITLKQATAVAGTGEKALAFTTQWANADDATSSTLTETAVVSNTFTPSNTNSKSGYHIIEIESSKLDVANGFDCFRVATADGTAQTITVDYILGGPRFAGGPDSFTDPLVD